MGEGWRAQNGLETDTCWRRAHRKGDDLGGGLTACGGGHHGCPRPNFQHEHVGEKRYLNEDEKVGEEQI